MVISSHVPQGSVLELNSAHHFKLESMRNITSINGYRWWRKAQRWSRTTSIARESWASTSTRSPGHPQKLLAVPCIRCDVTAKNELCYRCRGRITPRRMAARKEPGHPRRVGSRILKNLSSLQQLERRRRTRTSTGTRGTAGGRDPGYIIRGAAR